MKQKAVNKDFRSVWKQNVEVTARVRIDPDIIIGGIIFDSYCLTDLDGQFLTDLDSYKMNYVVKK